MSWQGTESRRMKDPEIPVISRRDLVRTTAASVVGCAGAGAAIPTGGARLDGRVGFVRRGVPSRGDVFELRTDRGAASARLSGAPSALEAALAREYETSYRLAHWEYASLWTVDSTEPAVGQRYRVARVLGEAVLETGAGGEPVARIVFEPTRG